MADSRLIASLPTSSQTPREILPKEWPDSLKLDYLNTSEQITQIAQRVELIGKAVYDLQVLIESL